MSVDIDHIVACYVEMARRCDAVVVEGAGGFLVPLGETTTGADLARALGLPVVLVVGMRLGCLNHALLSAEAIRVRGLTLAGWIANRIDPAMRAADDNIAYLRRRLDAPLLADVAHGAAAAPSTITIELPPTWK
jgi:dethiobiotin synthetase